MMKWLLGLVALILPAHWGNPTKGIVYKCSTLSRMIEIEEGLPPFLLSALTFVESSDMPWVVGVEGVAHRFYTKEGALNKIKELTTNETKNFDVGCMQINHYFHKDKFESAEDMLNPVRNVRYAARLLKDLYKETGSWEKAVAYYNCRDLRYSAPYAQKVYQQWNKIKSKGLPSFDFGSFANIPKDKPNAALTTEPTLSNKLLHRAKIAYLSYKRTLVRE